MDHDARICPFCRHKSTGRGGIYDSDNEGGYLIRRRKCKHCGVSYKTFEIVETEFKKVNAILKAMEEIMKEENGDGVY